VKLRTRNWRSGRALTGFLDTTIDGPARASRWFHAQPWLARAASWLVIALERAFPLTLISPGWCEAVTTLAYGCEWTEDDEAFAVVLAYLISIAIETRTTGG